VSDSNGRYEKGAILQDLVGIVESMIGDWETGFSGSIGSETLLVSDLGLESIDVVGLIIAIEEHYQRQDVPFIQLVMVNGQYIEDLSLRALGDFLYEHLNR
jgi:acyl carrier protein